MAIGYFKVCEFTLFPLYLMLFYVRIELGGLTKPARPYIKILQSVQASHIGRRGIFIIDAH